MSDDWTPKVTAVEFAAGYTGRSSVSASWLAAHGRAIRPCNCREADCDGWIMVNAASYAEDIALWEAGEGAHPSKLTADEWAAWLDGQPDA